MRIDEQVRYCTSFLAVHNGSNGASEYHPVGTAFFIGENVGRDRWAKYAVTARHVIDASRPHGSLWLRCGSRDGNKKKLFEFPQDGW